MSTGKEEKTVRQIMTRTEQLLTPLATHFGDLKSFTKYIVACMGAKAVQRKACQSGAAGRAMQKGAEMLICLRHDNVLLSIDAVERALRIAEEHAPTSNAGPATKALKTGVEDKRVLTEEQKANPFSNCSEEELECIKTFVSQMRHAATLSQAREAGKKRCADGSEKKQWKKPDKSAWKECQQC
eukprot:3217708-Rhodomonas_salina.3